MTVSAVLALRLVGSLGALGRIEIHD